jgi:hypothetical protein
MRERAGRGPGPGCAGRDAIPGGSWAEFPDCGGHRYIQGQDLNRRGQACVWFQHHAVCDEGLAVLEIAHGWDETWTVEDDETGCRALYVWQSEGVQDDD